jgi:hypothetical protein
MATLTARAPKSPGAAAPRTRKVEVEILDENEAAILTALPLHMLREQSCAGTLPGGIWREGRDYFVSAEQATRLRQLRAGIAPLKVFANECDIENRAAFEGNRANREAIASADARCAAERAQRQKEAEDRWAARMAADAKNKDAHYAAIGVHPS